MKHRMFALALCAVLLLSFVPGSALAAPPGKKQLKAFKAAIAAEERFKDSDGSYVSRRGIVNNAPDGTGGTVTYLQEARSASYPAQNFSTIPPIVETFAGTYDPQLGIVGAYSDGNVGAMVLFTAPAFGPGQFLAFVGGDSIIVFSSTLAKFSGLREAAEEFGIEVPDPDAENNN